MQIQNGIRIILCLLVFVFGHRIAIANDFGVSLSTSDGEVCLGEDSLSANTRIPDGWVGLEICFLQTVDYTGNWIDFQLRNGRGRVIGPLTIRHTGPVASSVTFPIFQHQPSGPMGDVFRLIEHGIEGPLRVYCIFMSPEENSDFELPPQGHPGYEKLNEIRGVLLAEYTPHEIRELGVNRVSRPALLKYCDSVEK